MAGHVFISYSRADAAYVHRLAEHLRDAGLPVWMDDKIDYGDQWETVIREMVDTCSVFVPVMSPESEKSAWVRRELHRAETAGKPVVPLLLAGEAFFRLSDVHYEDVRGGRLPASRFVTRLRHLLARPAGRAGGEVVDDRLQRTRVLIARGVEAVAGPVGRAMGPRGKGSVIRCVDGVFRDLATAEEIAENYRTDVAGAEPGVDLVRDLVRRISAEAGDGASTAVVLAHGLVTQVVRQLERGARPESVEAGIEVAAEHVLAELERGTREVETKEQISAIVTSALGERRIGAIIAEAMDKVGKEGAIAVEDNVALGLELELVEGMRMDRGFLSSDFVTDEVRPEVVLEDPFILLSSATLSRADLLVPLAEKVMQTGQPLLVVADGVEGEALATLVVNTIHGTFRSVAVGAPGYGPRRRELLRDLAIQTGGTVVDSETRLPEVDVAELGRARRAVVTSEESMIIDAAGDPYRIQARVDQLRAEIERSGNDHERANLQEQLAKLAGGVAVVRFGGQTPAETADFIARCERGVRLATAAVREGILPGGGAALVAARNRLDARDLVPAERLAGAQALLGVLAEPMAQLVRNARADLTGIVPNLAALRPGAGVDVTDLVVKDMVSAEIIDVAGAVRAAVSSAVTLASQVLRVG